MSARLVLACTALLGIACSSLPVSGPGAGWIYRHGGRMDAADGAAQRLRAEALFARLRPHCDCESFVLDVLDEERVGAFAFRDGSLFLTRGLLEQLSDDEVSAAIAHEIGHLDAPTRSSERMADAKGCSLLEKSGVGSQAMLELLGRLRATAHPDFESGLAEREQALRLMLARRAS